MLNCLTIKSGTNANLLSSRKQGTIKSLLKQRGIDSLGINLQDILTIYFEQTYLADYLLDTHQNNRDVIDYKKMLVYSFEQTLDTINTDSNNTFKQDKVNVHPDTIKNLSAYILNGDTYRYILDSLVKDVVNKSEYSILPKEFAFNYNKLLAPVSKDNVKAEDTSAYSVMLYPTLKVDSNEQDEQYVIFSAEALRKADEYKVNQTIFPSKTLNYLATFDYSSLPFKTLLDMLQRVSMDKIHTTEAMSFTTPYGILKHWFFNDQMQNIKCKDNKDIFVYFVEYLTKNNNLSLTRSDVEHMVDILQYMSDYRGNYLITSDPSVEDAKIFDTYKDLAFLLEYGKEAADDATAKDDEPSDDTTKDTEDTDADTSKDSEADSDEDDDTSDDSKDENEDENLDDLDFGDDDMGEDDDSTSESGSDSSDTSDSDTGNEASPEDINPLIQIIDSETFDDYLERKVLSNTLTSILANPPKTLSKETIDFLQYWLTEWYDLCSIETTKTLLKDVLKVSKD